MQTATTRDELAYVTLAGEPNENADDRDQHRTKPFLVLGATGKTGRRVARLLRERGLPVRAGSRSEEPRFDWQDRSTWRAVLEGVEAVYLTYYPDVAAPGAVAHVQAFANLAAEMDVERIALLSGRGEESAEAAEQALQASGTNWTVLRSSWFSQNFSENFLLDPVLSGVVALPVGDIPEPFVDVDDIAEVAVAALTEAGHAGRVYEMTGPRLLTFAQAIAEIAGASGRDIQFESIAKDRYAASLTELEVPAELVSLLTYLFTEVLDGRNAKLTDGIQQALGRMPRDFGDYARVTAATGVWSV